MLTAEQMEIVESMPSRTTNRIALVRNWYVMPVYREIERVYKLSEPEISALTWLGSSPGLRAQDLCVITSRPKNTISRALSQLIKRGLISSHMDERDKRNKILVLTASGALLYKELRSLWERQENAFSALFTPTELETLRQFLNRAIEVLLVQDPGDGKSAPAGKGRRDRPKRDESPEPRQPKARARKSSDRIA